MWHYLKSMISYDAGSDTWDIATHWNCQELFHPPWKEHLDFPHTHRHQGAPVQDLLLPVLFYDCETWPVTKALAKHLDAFDTWCLQKILCIPYTRHTTNDAHTYTRTQIARKHYQLLLEYRRVSESDTYKILENFASVKPLLRLGFQSSLICRQLYSISLIHQRLYSYQQQQALV